MNYELRTALVTVLFRMLFCAPLLFFGLMGMVSGRPMYFLLGVAASLTGAVMLAFPLVRLVADFLFSSWIWPSDSDPAPPLYGVPESLVKKGEYAAAMVEYQRIANEYPDEVKPYLDMLEITIVKLKDRAWGQLVYEEGLELMASEKARQAIRNRYAGLLTYRDPREEERYRVGLPPKDESAAGGENDV